MARSSESWSLNSPHIHGTDVPVEEPSTASTTEVPASSVHLVGLAQNATSGAVMFDSNASER
jgi:hypothetical protein